MMSDLRTDLEVAFVTKLAPLLGDGALKFRHVDRVTKLDLERMLTEKCPEAPFALVCYAGRDGEISGDVHAFMCRVSVFVGGLNFLGPNARSDEVYNLMGAVDGLLMMKHVSDGMGPVEDTGESLTILTEDGLEVWEKVYRVPVWLSNDS
jgi:hypothetical protein